LFGITGCYELNYPLDLAEAFGSVISVANESELLSVLFTGGISDFIYPIEVLKTDGSTVLINSLGELEQLSFECETSPFSAIGVELWYLAGLEIEECSIDLNYPIDATLPDGSGVTLSSMTDLLSYVENCM